MKLHAHAACALLASAGAVLAGLANAQDGADLYQSAYVKASNTGLGDHFGTGGPLDGAGVALSADGSTLAVGAPFESGGAAGVNGNADDDSVYAAGAVYVYTREDGGWRQEAYLKASNPGQGDYFGFVVALSGDGNTLAASAVYEASGASGVGGNQQDDSAPQAGAVYVFTRSAGAWSQQAYIKASNNAPSEALGEGRQFGFSLALNDAGNLLAVGAIGEASGSAGVGADQHDGSMPSAGAVYVFSRGGEQWTQQSYLKPTNPGSRDYFGYAVDLDAAGDVLAVGSYDEDGSLAATNERQDDDTGGAGAVYVFDHRDGHWRQSAYLKPTNSERNDSFGVAVALSDDGRTLVAAALDEDGAGTGVNPTPMPDWQNDTSTGAAYVFVSAADGWSQQAYVKASNTGAEDWFGARLALSGDGDTLAVGAQLEDGPARGINGLQTEDTAEDAGAAYLFRRRAGVWHQTAYLKSSNSDAYDEFGDALALSRDGNVLAVGARNEDSAALGLNGNQADNSADESGAVYLFERR
jgi:hypothetical protein